MDNLVIRIAQPEELIRISAEGIWINPDIPVDELAEKVFNILRENLTILLQNEFDKGVEHGKRISSAVRESNLSK